MTWHIRDIILIIIVLIVSFLAHEIGHYIVGSALGYEVASIGFFSTVFHGVLAPNDLFAVRVAGGIFQGFFLLLMTRFVPSIGFELRVAALIFFGYAAFEGVGLL